MAWNSRDTDLTSVKSVYAATFVKLTHYPSPGPPSGGVRCAIQSRFMLVRKSSLLLLAVITAAILAQISPAQEADGFVPLFDGKSLDGWDGDPRLWRVEDNQIVGSTAGVSELYQSFSEVPEPATCGLLALGAVGVGLRHRRRRRLR